MNVSYNLCSDLKKRLLPDSALDVEKYTSYRASLIACYFFRYHLQAFRHLYVLAAEPRVLVPREVDTKKACYVPLEVTLKVGNKLYFFVCLEEAFFNCIVAVFLPESALPLSSVCWTNVTRLLGARLVLLFWWLFFWFQRSRVYFVSLPGNSVLPRG